MKKCLLVPSAAIYLVTGTTALYALEPTAFKLGNFDITPTIAVDLIADDNIFRQIDNKVDSLISVIRPNVTAGLTDGRNSYDFEIEGTTALYTNSSVDNYNDWRVAGDIHLEATSRNFFDFRASFSDTTEVRGTEFSQFDNLPSDPSRSDLTIVGANYQYGNAESSARFVVNAEQSERKFTNNPIITAGRSSEQFSYGGTAFLSVLASAEFFVQLRLADITYSEEFVTVLGESFLLDSQESYAYVGMNWLVSDNLTGTVKVGRGEKEFDDPELTDQSIPAFELGVTWAPLSYSVFNLTAGQSFYETNGIGSAAEVRGLELNWEHNWTDAISSIATVEASNRDYVGAEADDKFYDLSIGFNYAYANWLDLNASITRNERRSSPGIYDFDRNVLTLGFVAGF